MTRFFQTRMLLACCASLVFVAGCAAEKETGMTATPELGASQPLPEVPGETSVARPFDDAENPAPGAPLPEAILPEPSGDLSFVPNPPEMVVPEKSPAPEIRMRSAAPAAADEVPPRYQELEDGRHLVDVYYATDRIPLFDTGVTGSLRTAFIVTGFVGMLFAGLMLAALQQKRFVATLGLGLVGITICGLWINPGRNDVSEAELPPRPVDDWYGSRRHEVSGLGVMEYGLCQVSLPSDHRVGRIETPSIFRLEFAENRDKHVVVQQLDRLAAEVFFESLQNNIANSPRREALLFIHGYNVGFSDAVKRTAQMAYDLKFPGAALCYTWPSEGAVASYPTDEANVNWTVLHLEQFLEAVTEHSGVERLHLIAHSMGNRALTQALERLALRNSAIGQQFGEVVMAAPDVDTSEFRQRYAPAIAKLARHATLYTSSRDKALMASASLHGYTRAGLSGETYSLPGIDTVDASTIDTSLIGHSYYGDHPQLIRDLRSLLDEGLPAENRSWLQKIEQDPKFHFWTFRREIPVAEIPTEPVWR